MPRISVTIDRSNPNQAGLRDNHNRGTVAKFLDEKIGSGSTLSIVSAYFTIYAYDALKRLESSVDSFRLTLQRTIDKIDRLERKITDFERHVDDNLEIDFDSLTPDQFEDPDFEQDEFTIGGRRRIHLGHLKLPEWLKEVRNDRTQLQYLYEKTKAVTPERDGKLAELRKLIEHKVRNPTTNRDGEANRKVLVFTAFADTARYLYQHAGDWARTELQIHTALVCGDGGNATTLGCTDYDDPRTDNLLDPSQLEGLIKEDLLFRDLAAEEPNAFERLCSLFDARTSDGADMSHYDELLKKTLASIENTFQKRATAGLLSGRGAVLPTMKETPKADGIDFELVTWLVIQDDAP